LGGFASATSVLSGKLVLRIDVAGLSQAGNFVQCRIGA
jgi:hypothetical protein